MRVNEREVQRLAESVVDALVSREFAQLKVPRDRAVARLNALFLENFRTEQEIEDEAEKLAVRHARQMLGMDQRLIVQGIKERLAKERGFAL